MTDPIVAMLVLLLPPLVQILIMVAARHALESGEPTRRTVELGHLLELKRLGTLVRTPTKIPDQSARSKPLAKSHLATEHHWADGLEHLVQLKRKRDDERDAQAFSKTSAPLPRN